MIRRLMTARRLVVLAAAGIVVAGLLAGTLAVASSIEGGAPSNERMLVPADPAWKLWPTNDRGQTYGTPKETAYGYHEPDLMRVCATNGETGYSLSADLQGPTPSSPEEALRWQAEQAGKVKMVPVYESDGVTQIGVFQVSGPDPDE